MDENNKRVADYFVVAAVPEDNRRPLDDGGRRGSSSPTVSSPVELDPITDVTVIIRSEGEQVPAAWYCIETTPTGFPADLNHGSFRCPAIYLCYRRGRDKPPLVDIGVLYEGRERIMADSEVVHTTLSGRSANLNNAGSKIFLTYRRAKENAPCNQLVVMDVCVLLMNKGETPPHAYCLVRKNLNKGIIGSDVYLCYKKSMNRPPLIRVEPEISDRFPLTDYSGCHLPPSVPMFCMPMGAAIEVWPLKALHPRPVFSTFVLTSDTAVKVYGAAITFYEDFDPAKLNDEERFKLQFDPSSQCTLKAMKSLCILSRWPFFETFENFMHFLYNEMLSSRTTPLKTPLEKYISHFMLEIPFPSPQRPKILVQLKSSSDDTILVSQPPEDLPLPLSGASFCQMLRNLGAENCINLLVLALAEQKILLHSLRPDVLTGVAEAVTSIIFPFVWQCPYIPLCPLELCDVLNAPLPFIVGVDSRYFDLFIPPNDVVCVDLDTNSIYLSESKKALNSKALPKKPVRVLRNTLDDLYQKLMRPNYAGRQSQLSPSHRFKPSNDSWKKFEQSIDRDVQEAFLKFMASILKGFRSFLRPIIRAPTVGATDPSALFDLEAFAASRDRNYLKFYQSLMKTQMFAHFIEERSFTMDKDSCLAFFDHCLDKIEESPDVELSVESRLIDSEEMGRRSDRTVFIPAPEPEDPDANFSYERFGKLNHTLYPVQPDVISASCSIPDSINTSCVTGASKVMSPLSKRTKQEIRVAQKIARRHADSPLAWAKHLLSCVYSLWFIHAPAFVKKSEECVGAVAALRTAVEVLNRMQEINSQPLDETCYRVMLLLCGEYSQPVLAVKVFFEMRRNGVTPNAITYGYYNKAVLESSWPAGNGTATQLWSKLRNVVTGINAFKSHGKKRARRALLFPEMAASDEIVIKANSTELSVDSKKSDPGYSSGRSLQTRIQGAELAAGNIFKDSKIRRGSVWRAESFNHPSQQDYSSVAGVLMTCTSLDDDRLFSHLKQRPTERPTSLRIPEELPVVPASDTIAHRRKSFLRSYSFGHDTRIIQQLQEGTLTALKHELERNHQVVPEEDLMEKTDTDNRTGVSEPESNHKPDESMTIDGDESGISSKSSSMPESFRKLSASAFKSHRSASIDGWFKARQRMKPQLSLDSATEALNNLSLFSPDKALSSLKSGIKYAAKLTGSPAKRPAFTTFIRSASTEQDSVANKTEDTQPKEAAVETYGPDESASKIPEVDDHESEQNRKTPKTPKNKSSNRVDYWNSTLKSAASSVASRFSEIKSNLSANSPAKFTGTISQWANMMAEKIPAGLIVDDDDNSSDQSFDLRRTGSVVSEDELSERSREDSVARRGMFLFNVAVFDVVERHYLKNWEERTGEPTLLIQMTSCCHCYVCSAIIFDEEVMEGWTADDSNLNTQCVRCSARFVPLLTISVTDCKDTAKQAKSFTVPYLSPLVLRKEVENVLEHEGDWCLLNNSFVDAHPIIYWNLVWYFERVNLPSFLPELLLPSPPPDASQNVKVVCLWDNEALHDEWNKPLYKLWQEQKQGSEATVLQSLATKKREVSHAVMEQVIHSIEVNDMMTSMKTLANERLVTSGREKHSYNLYRDLLFLTFAALGRDNIDQVAFDREYRRSFESLSSKLLLSLPESDRPPSFGAIFCRRCFKKLDIGSPDSSQEVVRTSATSLS